MDDDIRLPDATKHEKLISDEDDDPYIQELLNNKNIEGDILNVMIESRRTFIKESTVFTRHDSFLNSTGLGRCLPDQSRRNPPERSSEEIPDKISSELHSAEFTGIRLDSGDDNRTNPGKNNLKYLCYYLEKVNSEDKYFYSFYEEICISITKYLSNECDKLELDMNNYDKVIELINSTKFDAYISDAINNLELELIAIAQHKEWLFENIVVKEPLGIRRNKVLENSQNAGIPSTIEDDYHLLSNPDESEEILNKIIEEQSNEISDRIEKFSLFKKMLLSLSVFDNDTKKIKDKIIDDIVRFENLEIDKLVICDNTLFNNVKKFIMTIRIDSDTLNYLHSHIIHQG